MAEDATIEWFGATTYRLKACGLTIFLDTWLERPVGMKSYLTIEDAGHVDYIFISHAHFDHLPGCDRLAKRTGAVVIANGEAINVLRSAGVPDEQLLPVAGGERIPLFHAKTREDARQGRVKTAPGPPGAPARPDPSLAAMSVHAWPSLHCLLPAGGHENIPDIMNTGTVYTGASEYACTIDITFGMKHGLLKLDQIIPAEKLSQEEQDFMEYVHDREKNVMSNFDGGQMTFSFQIGVKTLLWNSHLGGYKGILQNIEPKPDVLILSVAGRANFDGRPFDGSAAQAATSICTWLGEPRKVIWCLHDDAPIKPFRTDVTAATQMVEGKTRSRVTELEHAAVHQLFDRSTREEERHISACVVS